MKMLQWSFNLEFQTRYSKTCVSVSSNILYDKSRTSSYWTAMSSFFFLTSGQYEAGTWDPNYTPGVDILDHDFL